MSDDRPPAPPPLSPERWKHIIAESESRAKDIRAAARSCTACGESMLGWGGGRSIHYSCDPDYPLAGTRCTCRQGCSGSHWGNGPTRCDPNCAPCRIMQGRTIGGRQRRR